jgi:flagellar hook-length control protein FliK
MTQIASFDLGAAAAAKRQQTPNLGASKGHGDFMAAFRQAATEARKQERAQDADRAAEARAERDRDTGCADEAQEAFEANDNSQAERAERPKPADQHPPQDKAQAKAADQTHDAPVKPQAPADKPAEPNQDAAPVAQTPVEAPAAETPAEPQPALDAQAVLALQLATGGQVAQPAVTSQLHAQAVSQAATEVVDHALEVTATEGHVQAQAQTQAAANVDQATQKAMAEALRQAQAQAQAEPAKAQAQANGLATAQATAHAQANAQSQSPAFLAQAARDLGGITMQVSTAKPETPVTTPVAPVAEGQVETTNLSIVLNELETQPLAKGPIAPVTMLDGADGTEMPSQLPSLTTEDEEAAAVLATETESTPVAPLLNGDRGVGDVAKAESAKAPASPVRAEDVLPQVTKHLDQLKANQANAIKLQLYPEHLGKMEIKVVSHQGVISAQLTADSHAVKGMLESQVAQLQRTFAEMGLKVDKVEVTIASSQMNFDAQGQATQQGDTQQFGRQSQNQGAFQGSGYQQWLGDEPIDDAVYAQLDQAAVDYVA